MKKKRSISIIVVMFAVFFISTLSAQAALELRGTDSEGNRLIYDTDLHITWYDYTNSHFNWETQVDWAFGLEVSGGDLVGVYDDWRLPTTVDGPYVNGYDGTTTAGYNITSSEMGHLFYMEFGNQGFLDTSGDYVASANYGLNNTGDFLNLLEDFYWSGTANSAYPYGAWFFETGSGAQDYRSKANLYYAVAVRPGDVSVAGAVVPEPISSTLFLIGVATLGFRRFRKTKVSP